MKNAIFERSLLPTKANERNPINILSREEQEFGRSDASGALRFSCIIKYQRIFTMKTTLTNYKKIYFKFWRSCNHMIIYDSITATICEMSKDLNKLIVDIT